MIALIWVCASLYPCFFLGNEFGWCPLVILGQMSHLLAFEASPLPHLLCSFINCHCVDIHCIWIGSRAEVEFPSPCFILLCWGCSSSCCLDQGCGSIPATHGVSSLPICTNRSRSQACLAKRSFFAVILWEVSLWNNQWQQLNPSFWSLLKVI